MKKILFILSLCVSNFISGCEQGLMPSTNAVPSPVSKITQQLRSTGLKHPQFREQLQKELRLDNDFFKKLDQKDFTEKDFEYFKQTTKNLTLQDIKNLQTLCTEKQSSFKNQWGEKCCMCMGATCIVGGFCLWKNNPIPNVGPALQPTAEAKSIGTLMEIVGLLVGATAIKSANEKDRELFELAKIKNDLLKLKKINVNDKFPETANQPSKKSTKSNKGKSKTE